MLLEEVGRGVSIFSAWASIKIAKRGYTFLPAKFCNMLVPVFET
jgi:hypothetical protein